MANKPTNESQGSYIAPKGALPPPNLVKPNRRTQNLQERAVEILKPKLKGYNINAYEELSMYLDDNRKPRMQKENVVYIEKDRTRTIIGFKNVNQDSLKDYCEQIAEEIYANSKTKRRSS